MRLALTGPLYSGKSTLAKALGERGYVVLDYSRYLKEIAVKALRAIGLEVTVEQIEADKEKYRQFLIEVGHLRGFDEGFGVEDMIDELGTNNAVFDNVRYPAQFEALEKAGFVLVRLTTPQTVRYSRGFAKGISRDEYDARMTDPSEHGMDGEIAPATGTIFLSVNGHIDDVVNELMATIEVLEAHFAEEYLVEDEEIFEANDGILEYPDEEEVEVE